MENKRDKHSHEKPVLSLPGTVEKIIEPTDPNEPEKVQIAIDGADELYKEIRVENSLTDPSGDEVSLTPGADVHIRVEADQQVTRPKKQRKKPR